MGWAQKQNNIITLKNKEELLLVGKKIYYLEDKNGGMAIEEVLEADKAGKFTLNNKDVFARPATSSAFWFKFTFQNLSSEDAWLEIGSSFATWYIDFYSPDSLGKYYPPHLTGTMRPQNKKYYDIIHAFWLPLSKTGDVSQKTYYIRITEESSFEAPFQIGTIRSLQKEKTIHDYLTAGFVGLLIIMILYNLFLFFSVKENVYLLYSCYLIWGIFTVTFRNNYSLLPDSLWWYKYYFVWHPFAYLFIGLFCIHYLGLKERSPLLRKILLAFLLLICVLFPVMSLIGIKHVQIISYFQLSITFVSLTCLISGFYLVFKGYKPARFYTLGWTFLLLAIIAFFMVINGLLPFNPFTRNIIYFGTALEVWMFSLALGDRVNIMRREKAATQKALLEKTQENEKILKEQNEVLESKVKLRTSEIQSVNEELNSTVEELNITLEVVGKQKQEIEQQNFKITSSIRYAQTIQNAILPSETALQHYFPNSFVIYRPKDVVSGDYYWVYENDDEMFLAAIDCTGHGVAGAFMTFIANTLLEETVRFGGYRFPARILEKVDSGLEIKLNQQGRGIYREGMDMVLIKIKKQKDDKVQIVFAGAKRPLYYIEKGVFKEIAGTRRSIGSAYEKEAPFVEQHITLEKEDMLFLTTDGYIDQNDNKQKRFGSNRFKDLILKISPQPTEVQKSILETELNSFQGFQEQRDDITVLGIKL